MGISTRNRHIISSIDWGFNITQWRAINHPMGTIYGTTINHGTYGRPMADRIPIPTRNPQSAWEDSGNEDPIRSLYSPWSLHVLYRHQKKGVIIAICERWCWNMNPNICPCPKSPSFVGKYTIHGAYGIDPPISHIFSHPRNGQLSEFGPRSSPSLGLSEKDLRRMELLAKQARAPTQVFGRAHCSGWFMEVFLAKTYL